MAVSYGTINMIREWAPLTDLFSKLPIKTQVGIFQQDVKLTCVDVVPEFVALGTNLGIVYWYNRKSKEMQRLRCENFSVPITSLKIVSTVDYMVASGNRLGNISIFQIPKSHPESVPENLKPKNRQVERYTVTELHKGPISALEWSKNGTKLFSGDKNGCIVLTEIDFYMHICKSMDILNESYEVVQLSYNQQRLLVSTTYRSIICEKLDKWKVSQVGTKDRKVLGKFGGIIFQSGFKISDTCLYCSRPGLRIWVANINGNVQKTLLFKELLTKECPEVSILNPVSKSMHSLKQHKEPSFGVLLPFSERLIVTYDSDMVYILDPQEMSILSTISHLRSVLHVATHKDEIFILEKDRSLIRISYRPDPANSNALCFDTATPTPIRHVASELQSANAIPAISSLGLNNSAGDVYVLTDETIIMNAEEAIESPVKTQRYDPEVQNKGPSTVTKGSDDKILFKKFRYKNSKSVISESTKEVNTSSSEEKDMHLYTQPTLMNLSSVGILPDLRSPESIKYDIEYKEKILADVLCLDKVNIASQEYSDSDCETERNDTKEIIKNAVPEPVHASKGKRVNQEQKYSKKKENTSSVKNVEEPASCIVPSDWKLNDLQLMDEGNSLPDNDQSFSDWEIV